MTLAVLNSMALVGMAALPVRVEIHLGSGLPNFTIVGLADAEVKESRERVRAALLSSGFEFPHGRLTVNLAPADLPKESGRFDLPIAIGVLLVSGQIDLPEFVSSLRHQSDVSPLKKLVFAGELSLTGALVPIRGSIAIALAVVKDARVDSVVLPRLSARQAADVQGCNVLPADNLRQVVDFLSKRTCLAPLENPARDDDVTDGYPCLSDVHGQESAKRALEVAAAGGHNLLFIGPPGVGKSMLAQRLPGILPPLTSAERIEVAGVAAYFGVSPDVPITRPFRAPHHSASVAAIVGGGKHPRPGEITLAHHGALFLDEIPEFERRTLEALREPLENHHISIARAMHKVVFPADFQLIAAMNPCPCGNSGEADKPCRCSAEQIRRYQRRLSSPLLDRIDMVVQLCRGPEHTSLSVVPTEQSKSVRRRVSRASEYAISRQACRNSRLQAAELSGFCGLDTSGSTLLDELRVRYRFSYRSLARLKRVARTCADLDLKPEISRLHLAEAFKYRVENLTHLMV